MSPVEPTHPTSTDGRPAGGRPVSTTDRSSGAAFIVAGVGVLASVAVPRALPGVTNAAPVAGLVLVAVAVSSAVVGVVGLSRRLDAGPTHRRVAAVGTGLAGLGVVGLLAGVGLALAGVDLVPLTGVADATAFRAVALAMATGLGLGYLAVGSASGRADGARLPRYLLHGGGAALLVPSVVKLAHATVGVAAPHWLVLGTLGVVGLDSLAVGLALRARPSNPSSE